MESSRARMRPQVMMDPGKGTGPFSLVSPAHWMSAVPRRSSDLRRGYFLMLRATAPLLQPAAASTRLSWGKELFSPKGGPGWCTPASTIGGVFWSSFAGFYPPAGPEQRWWCSLMVRIYRGVLCMVVSEKERSRVLLPNAGKEGEDDIFKLGSKG